MYKSIYYDKSSNKIHLWGDGKHNDLGHSVHDFKEYAYAYNNQGKYKTIDGLRCDKVTEWSDTAVEMNMVYEHDVRPEMRFLIDKYWEDDKSSENTVLYIDIEVMRGDKYSKAHEAFNVINAMTYKLNTSDEYICLILSKEGGKVEDRIIDIGGKSHKVKLYHFYTEMDLLKKFMSDYKTLDHTVISGWNVEFFDIPYLYHRILRLFGSNAVKFLSPDIGIVKTRDTKMGHRIDIAGVSILDYLFLYKEFTYTELPNYRLETVSLHELSRTKIEYEGNLDQLYYEDIDKFIMYNIVDVELVEAIDTKNNFIKTAIGICHKGHVDYENFRYPSSYLDGACITFCKRNNLVAASNKQKDSGKAKGAFVKKPIPGLYKWIYDLDLTSLYPMTIISLNISPETKYGRIKNWDEEKYVRGELDGNLNLEIYKDDSDEGVPSNYYNNETKNINKYELFELLETKNLSVASNGCLYDKNKRGIIPSILDTWFNERAKYKKLRDKYRREGNKELAEYYDQQQLITKILLNSMYGVLLLPTFRFYDKNNGEAVTLTGQSVINWASLSADAFYNREIGTNEKYCIYVDTDSIFEPIEPIFNHRYGDINNFTDDEILEKSRPIINEVQSFINKSYDYYAKNFHNITEHRWDIKQELVSKRAFWIGNINIKTKEFEGKKKRYAQLILESEGHKVRYIDYKGVDVVRSNFPKKFREYMTDVLERILDDHTEDKLNERLLEIKSEINSIDYNDVMSSSSVNGVTEYSTGEFGKYKPHTPVHVKAALNYNSLMELMGIINVSTISDGDKITWCYVIPNKYGISEIALKGFDDPPKIKKFVEGHIDRNKMFNRLLMNKLENFWKSLKWSNIRNVKPKNNFF